VATDVHVQFAGIKAVDGVDLSVYQGEVLGLIGPNGAGKTTFVNAITGFQRPNAGRVSVGGEDVTGWSAVRLARAGVVRTFQSVRLFARLSVSENLEAAALGSGLARRDAGQAVEEVIKLLELEAMRDTKAGALPSGSARCVGIGRALAMRPRFLLLDEPAAGLDEGESDELLHAITDFRARHRVGIVVIEHDMRVIMRMSDRLHVLDHGKTLASGRTEEVRNDPAVITAYLGRRRESSARDA
jgi:branched-chain amino acid transport system ATP-binding protein